MTHWKAGVLFCLIASAGDLLAQGDATRGLSIFEGKGACLTCHRVSAKGSRMGPDLTDIGTLRAPEVLAKALLAPNPEVQPQNKLYRVATTDGTVVMGKLINQDIFSIQMLDSKERLISFQKAKLKEQGSVPTPAMPSYEGKLTKAEQSDVLAYLATLKGVVKQ